MKIFIAGGTGVIGKRVVPILVEDGHQVGIISRSDKNDFWINKNGAKPLKSDLFDINSLRRVGTGYEVFLHLATAIPTKEKPNPMGWGTTMKLRTEGTNNLIKVAMANNCKLYLQQSNIFVYGHQNGNWVDESLHLPIPLKNGELYDQNFKIIVENLREMENIVQENILKGLPAVILRFGWFYSWDSQVFQDMIMDELSKFINYDVYWNMVRIDDVAKSILKTINNYEKILGKTFNISEPPVNNSLFLNHVSLRTSGGKIFNIWKDEFLKDKLLQKINNFSSNVRVNSQKAKDMLNWSPEKNYKEGIQMEIQKFNKEWMKKTKPKGKLDE